ncbi:hypothetical protein JOQ06_007070 [Pogonophryne albipinna]|uniref:Immunoglobulin V-set domain-containing protein n=1 Tax=Pogonophryne albipinna TaxID=1090488 RepID=A0AAD6FHN0_9TELE|nr:hypothetical protein JOQ06_007070 [Pogonophryne albipinna]
MNISRTLICFFLLFSLQDGSTGLVSDQLTLYSVTEGADLTKSDSGKYGCGSAASSSRNSSTFIEIIVVDAKLDGAEKTIDARTGGNIVVECSFTHIETNMYFCKEECEGDILVETTSNKYAIKDRYSIRHVKGGFVFVSIEQLTQSDSGWYRCGLDRPDSKDPYQRFRLNVTDALTTSTPSSSVSSASSTTTIQSESSTTSPASSKTTKQPEETKGVILYVSLTLVVLVIVSSLAVLVFCRKRTCKAKKPHVETQCASAPEVEDDPSQHAYPEIKFVSVGSSQSGFHAPLYSSVNNPQ